MWDESWDIWGWAGLFRHIHITFLFFLFFFSSLGQRSVLSTALVVVVYLRTVSNTPIQRFTVAFTLLPLWQYISATFLIAFACRSFGLTL
jgi:hypothetical protein